MNKTILKVPTMSELSDFQLILSLSVLSYRFESIVRFNPLGMSITLDEALVSIEFKENHYSV